MFACLHGSGNLTVLAFEFSPVVERTASDTVTLDASGLDRLFGFPQDIAAAMARRAAETGVRASLALASNPDAAICAARGFPGVSIVPYGDEAKFLGPLPVASLAPSPELLETLERWGVRRLRDLAALPPLGIAERLGPEGLRLRELARGEAQRKLVPLEDPPRFEDGIELDYPVDLLEPLAFLLARLLNGLCARLAAYALAANELRLRLTLENPGGACFSLPTGHAQAKATHERTLRLPVPALDPKTFLKLLQLDLAAHPPAAPVVHIWMGMNPVKPRSAQSGLFVPAAPEPVKLELTLARIKAIVGDEHVGSPELLDTHRPDAFRLRGQTNLSPGAVSASPGTDESVPRRRFCAAWTDPSVPGFPPGFPARRLALRIFRPPRAARVTLASGRPGFIAAEGIRGKVLELAGPWRTSGDWWTSDPWSRDEWDIALSDGAIYRLYCEPRGWFVEGSYD